MARLHRPSNGVSATKVAESGYVEASVAPASAPPKVSLRNVIPVNDVIAGGCARAASQSTIHPLDTVKVRMQALAGKSKAAQEAAAAAKLKVSTGKYGVGSALLSVQNGGSKRVALARGASAVGKEFSLLYRGVFGAASGAGLAIGTYFAFYGAAKKLLERHSDYSVSKTAFIAGGIGALGSSLVKVPAAVCIRSVQAGVYPNVFAAAGTITKAAGWRGLFTGYAPTLLEDIPDMAVKFAAYETLRTMHRNFFNKDDDEADAFADISMGLIAGSVAAAATTPLDVVKTRMMCNAAQRPSFGGAIMGVWKEAPKGFIKGKVPMFFTGVGPRAFSNGINSAIFFMFFEAMRAGLKRREERIELEKMRLRRVGYNSLRNEEFRWANTDQQVGRVTEASLTNSSLMRRKFTLPTTTTLKKC
jgi:solute carrier family 25 S-adenosylmethionine transporter 26